MIDTIKAVLENTQNRTPMVHSITNNVTINDCANIILAAGGTAIMAQDEREVEEITSHAQALVINMGAVRAQEAMLRAAKIAKRNGRPVVLDPVAAGASTLRREMCSRLLSENLVSVMAAERCQQQPLPNLRFVSFDAAELREVFAPGEVDRIYLNFSDPWPPNRQRKRRLTWRAYLEVYDEILRQQGDLCFKTDNQRFFEWSLQEICQFGWLIQNISLDLHNSDFEGNVMTEYEEKFSAEGYRIYRLEARRRLPEFLKK